MYINMDGYRRGRPKKIWIDCARHDMCVKSVNTEMSAERVEWKKKTCCDDLT